MKKIVLLIAVMALCLCVFISCDDTQYAHIEIEGYGTIVIELDAEQAPITVENFVKLAHRTTSNCKMVYLYLTLHFDLFQHEPLIFL